MRLIVLLVAFAIQYGATNSPPLIASSIDKCEMRAPIPCPSGACALVPTCTNEHQVKPALAVSSALDCSPNEEFKICGSSCEDTCERNCFPTGQCAANVCRCKSGFVRKDGICVEKSACSVMNCKQNETYDTCGGCERKCGEPQLGCPAICGAGKCVCSVGYVRNLHGNCVIERDCPAQPGIFTTTHGPTTCAKANEELRVCGSKCEPSCDRTLPICTMECVPNVCQCKFGFYRKNNGECVSINQCSALPGTSTSVGPTVCTKPNEEMKQCGSKCEPSCNRTMPICTMECVPNACQCKIGFYRSNNGECVQLNQCSAKPTCSMENEELKECGSRCEPACNNTTPICTKECVPNVCQCKLGFYRNVNGMCVALQRCSAIPACTKQNEEFKTCGTKCEATCNNTNPFCTMDCVPDVCQCVAGFVRNTRGDCVRTNECTNETSCKPAEVFKTCGTACEPSCDNLTPTFCTMQCVPNVCQCAPGYYRDKISGNCVAQAYCNSTTSTCKPAEVFKACGTACEPSCDNMNPTFCTDNCIVNVCQCAPGYYRDKISGNCVAQAYCNAGSPSTVPPQRICAANEEFTNCGKSCEPTCINPTAVCTQQCIPNSCQCKIGFVRSLENGSCIPPQTCPSVANCNAKPNEEFKECGSPCEPNCAQLHEGLKIACPAVCANNVCRCKLGFYRNSSGTCVEEQQCDKSNSTCVGLNEEWKGCGTFCEPTCDNKTPMCNKACKMNACQCKAGFIRNANGTCIAEQQCQAENPCNLMDCAPGLRCELRTVTCVMAPCNPVGVCVKITASSCFLNETFSECGGCDEHCGEESKICTKECKPAACMCKAGYSRNDQGQCVLKQDCQSTPVLTCANIRCGGGQVCKMVDVQCIKAPCPARPQCVNPDQPTSSCLNVKCSSGSSCVMVNDQFCSRFPCTSQPRCLNDTALTCNTVKCAGGQSCQYYDVPCLMGPCYPQPRCVPNNPVTSCATMECAAGKVCKEIKVNCLIPPCPAPEPICVDQETNTCANVRCTAGTFCEMVDENCSSPPCHSAPQCINNTIPTCASTSCFNGQQCRMVKVTCVREPCNPVPRCQTPNTPTCGRNETYDSCGGCEQSCIDGGAKICPAICRPGACICSSGYYRNTSGSCVRHADCTQALTCANIRCSSDKVCKMVDVQCIRAPCPPQPQCVDAVNKPSCLTVKCSAGNSCVMVTDQLCAKLPCSSQPRCVNDTALTCNLMECATGNSCQYFDVHCITAPCWPQPRCFPNNPVTSCADKKCAAGQICQEIQVDCIIPPCFAPEPICVDQETNTCMNVRCTAGKFCEMVDENCNNPPCKRSPLCLSNDLPTCASTSCMTGQECRMVKVMCASPPCNPVPVCKIPTTPTCGKNETYDSCGGCEQKCGDSGNKICPFICRPGACVCSTGYSRNFVRNCVRQSDCSNQVDLCLTMKCAAGEKCEMKDAFCNFPICPKFAICENIGSDLPAVACATVKCAAGTHCVVNVDKNCKKEPCLPGPICVPENQCSINEEFVQCVCEQNCSQSQQNCSASCTKGCQCSKGFKRNSKGLCIHENQCRLENPNPVTNIPCPANQTYSTCPQQTDLSCNKLDAPISIVAMCPPPRCTCSNGYAKNVQGSCVKIADCGANNGTLCGSTKCASWQTCQSAMPGCNKPPCTPVKFCSPSVQTTTSKPNSQPGSVCAATSCAKGNICREVPLVCNPVQCFYKAECVPAANNTSCGKNEMWDSCGGCETKCGEQKICPASCRPGACVCAFGYFRKGAECVLKNSCTSETEPTKCGKNEISHPCNNCEPTCSKPTPDCSKVACNKPSCVCAPGFVRKDGQCVTWKQCDSIPDNKNNQCGNNEVFSTCKPTCETTCKGTEQVTQCTENSSKCSAGCACRPFYKRDDKGKCIHQKFCYKHATCEENEEWNKCMQCEAKCGSKNANCDSQCTSGCACSEGFSRNSKGKCVKKC